MAISNNLPDPSVWQRRLAAQAASGLWRQSMPRPAGFADFCSNDFLGLAAQTYPSSYSAGATGSRLVSGLHSELLELEAWAANWLCAERVVYFPTGYQANLAVLQALATRHDVVLMDERIHASLRDAARLTLARTHFFNHNDEADLARWLAKPIPEGGQVYVVTESVFSMAGAQAPLPGLAAMCAQAGACLVIDEAHSVGLHGPAGSGLCVAEGVLPQVRILPLGKAAGTQGALVAGSAALGHLLENFARPLIYSTAPAPVLVATVLAQLQSLVNADTLRVRLSRQIEIASQIWPKALPGCIVPVAPREQAAWPALIMAAQQARLWVRPIRYPTVPKGEECLRITLHAYQTDEELQRLEAWAKAFDLQPLAIATMRPC